MWALTLPQLVQYLKHTNKWIEFEVRVNSGGLFGLTGLSTNLSSSNDGFEELSEDNLDDFLSIFQ